MPRGTGNGQNQGTNPNVHNQGTNPNGNNYTAYNDGRYRYSNAGPDGKTQSSYYDAGSGHSFYRKNGPEGYSWHENANQGFRNYTPNNNGSGSGNSK